MYIEFSDGEQLRGDGLLRAVMRSDIAPMPVTLELDVREDSKMFARLSEGSELVAGREKDDFTVVKFERVKDSGLVQGSNDLRTMRATCVLSALKKITYRRENAVIKEATSFGEVYSACGATAKTLEDMAINRFTSFIGHVPTYPIAVAMHEQSAAIIWRDKKLLFRPINRLKDELPGQVLQADRSEEIKSEFLERHAVPWVYSVKANGELLMGDKSKGRIGAFRPRTPERILFNMSKALVVRRVLNSDFAAQINAGGNIEIAGIRWPIVTAAHVFEADALSTGLNQFSRFWLGQVQ